MARNSECVSPVEVMSIVRFEGSRMYSREPYGSPRICTVAPSSLGSDENEQENDDRRYRGRLTPDCSQRGEPDNGAVSLTGKKIKSDDDTEKGGRRRHSAAPLLHINVMLPG